MPLTPGTKESYLGAFLENIIYGFYLSAFIECCILFRVKERRKDAKQKYMIFTAVLMFVLITVRCIIDTYRCVIAFDATDEFIGIGNPDSTLDLVTNACWFFLTPFADAFIIFRTYYVWDRNWLVVIIPVLLCLANLGSSIWLMTALAHLELSPAVWGNIVFKSLNLFLAVTLCTNIICTALISFRILRIYHQVSGLEPTSGTYSMRAVSAIVESAAIYTLVLVGALVSNKINSYVNFVFFNCTPPTIGLVFSYIIIRVSRGTSYGDSQTVISRPSIRFREAHSTRTQAYELDRNPGSPLGPGPLQLHLEGESETQIAIVKHSLDRDMV
ncbi:Ras-domain-containing protein [Mycena sanguinolenta]|uniref:Ras-domain-containing protein n=1 Tax=Mycena sanguinolenta TaxID=230812 RepID=A0A8H7DMK0_9AGAR|nr:Ras-domain-containing protein [Mycena sanguinolenta]